MVEDLGVRGGPKMNGGCLTCVGHPLYLLQTYTERVKLTRWHVIAALVTVTILVWYAVSRETPRGILTVVFLDVGQGDAIYIESPSGTQLLIDGGSGTAVLRELGRVMPFYDRSLDVVLATHADTDHSGGLQPIFERFRVSHFVADSELSELATALAAESGVHRIPAQSGTRLNLGGGALLTILFPDRPTAGWDTNDASVVARLEYAGRSFLFSGDAPSKIEKYLALRDGAALRSDVLKLGHHGSDTSTSEPFLGAVRPRYAVISVGAGNRYGHPDPEVLERVAERKILIERTDISGRLIFTVSESGQLALDSI